MGVYLYQKRVRKLGSTFEYINLVLLMAAIVYSVRVLQNGNHKSEDKDKSDSDADTKEDGVDWQKINKQL
jgi:hypothetical protein